MPVRERFPRCIAATLLLALACAGALPAMASPPPASTEQAQRHEIDALIARVARQRGVVFIRNGSEYDAQQAADHLRRKLRAAGGRVHTAEQMIDLLGTRSSMSGMPYHVRLPDGRTLDSAAWLRGLLREQRAEAPGK